MIWGHEKPVQMQRPWIYMSEVDRIAQNWMRLWQFFGTGCYRAVHQPSFLIHFLYSDGKRMVLVEWFSILVTNVFVIAFQIISRWTQWEKLILSVSRWYLHPCRLISEMYVTLSVTIKTLYICCAPSRASTGHLAVHQDYAATPCALEMHYLWVIVLKTG